MDMDIDMDMVRDLLRPDAYPAPRPARVELETTHISWVFLTDSQVWKVKRPVNLGFLDFSTPDKRQFFCEEEVRLNGRLARDVYLGVVPVRLGPRGYSFLDEGEIVDHAVKMRRLPAASSARALVQRDGLLPAHLAALAQRLARFYEEAPAVRDLDAAAALRANVEENLTALHALRSRMGDSFDPERWEKVAAAQRSDLRRLADLFGARSVQGRIRDGHGDLRLEHVYFPEGAAGEPVILDAVEFSQRFRTGDVALDVAFLAMELQAEGRPDLAEYFLYRFARVTNDYDLYPLIDFYACYRALVRAKVACLLAADPMTPFEKARRKDSEAATLLGLAHARACGRAPRPAVIAVGGLAGAGKSTLAEALAARFGVPVVSSDLTRKYLGHVGPTARGAKGLYSAEHTRRTQDELLRRADLVLAAGRGVILDATFGRADLRQRGRALAAARDATFLFVEATCADATMRARLAARARERSESDADVAVLDWMRTVYEPADELPPRERLILNTERDAAELVAQVERHLPPMG